MFIKPYRPPVCDLSMDNRKLLLEQDLNNAPDYLVNALQGYFKEKKISAVIHAGMSVSFQYSDSTDYLVRDVGHSSLLLKELLDKKFSQGYQNQLDSYTSQLLAIDNLLNPEMSSIFNGMEQNRTDYRKSIVVGLDPLSDNIEDIDYVDMFYDTNPDLFVVESTAAIKAGVKHIKRTGISFRIFMKKQKAKFSLNTEIHRCVETGDTGIRDSKVVDSTKSRLFRYTVDSKEFKFEFCYDDFESSLILYLNTQKEKISKLLGYEVKVVDKQVLDLINMIII